MLCWTLKKGGWHTSMAFHLSFVSGLDSGGVCVSASMKKKMVFTCECFIIIYVEFDWQEDAGQNLQEIKKKTQQVGLLALCV